MTKETIKEPNNKYLENEKYSFFVNQLLETGLSFEENIFSCTRDGKPFSSPYMIPDKDGNVRFYVPDIITGDVEQYLQGEDSPKQKAKDWYLTRWKTPKQTASGPAKYTPVKGAGTRVLFTPAIIDCYKNKKQIKTLFIVEGYKKALSANIAGGLPIIGMNGLSGFRKPGSDRQLRKEIKEVLITCNVQRVVVIYDSDMFDLYSSKTTAEEKRTRKNPETYRPNQFMRAAMDVKIIFEPFCDVFLAHPHQHPIKKYGLDDLLLEHRNISPINSPVKIKNATGWNGYNSKPKDKQQTIINDLLGVIKSHEKGKFFNAFKLSSLSDFKIKQIFHLGNVQEFYDFYRNELQKLPNGKFRFFKYTYQVQGDGTIKEVEDERATYLGIENKLGKLYRYDSKGVAKELANFSIKVLFQIDSEEDPKRICEIKNHENITRIVEVTSKTFVSLADFQALMISKGDFIWKGTKDDLLDLMTILFRFEKPAVQINQLGWQPVDQFYSFSNGIVTPAGFFPVDEYGMVTYNDQNFYLPAWSKFNSRDYESFKDIKKFSHFTAQKPTVFRKWKEQFCKVYGKNGEIAVCYFVASLFSDIIFSHKSGIGFPLLWSAGKPQTGKSTICESLLNMFGQKSDSISLPGKSTVKYFIARFAQIRNGLVHLDEYSNTKVDKSVKETLKNIFDRIGYGKKSFSNDFRTQIVPILSAAVVSGEELPTDNHALFTRTILMMWNKSSFTPEEKNSMRRLKDMEEEGLTNITVELLKCRQLIEDHFDEVFNRVFADFYNKFKTKKIEDRMLKNAAWIVTPVAILMQFQKIDYDRTLNEVEAVFYDNIEKQSAYMQDNTDISKFWDIVEILHREKFIAEGTDFKFIDDCLALQLRPIHHYYTVTARKLGYEKILDRSTLENYLTNEPYYREMKSANGRKKQIRFDGNPVPAMFFFYEDIGINLKSSSKTPDEKKEDMKNDTPPIPDISEVLSQEEEELLPI